ncbi:MAG TPA: hypothetical protein PKD32_07590 [Saprospiraceae bacterium]|mgnify:CR=1 FL=1|nr:hypothetical protein [Saprospiraceae bacterium]
MFVRYDGQANKPDSCNTSSPKSNQIHPNLLMRSTLFFPEKDPIFILTLLMGSLTGFLLNAQEIEKLKNTIASHSSFVENLGQFNNSISYQIKLSQGEAGFYKNGFSFSFLDSTKTFNKIDFKLNHTNTISSVIGIDQIERKNNYFIDNKSFPKARNYNKLNYNEIYNNIDWVFYTTPKGELEYDFIVHPKGIVDEIEMQIEGLKSYYVDQDGYLIMNSEVGDLKKGKPYSYQIINGQKKEIESKFIIENNAL